VQAPSGAPDWLEAFTAAERPDLWAQARDDGLFNGLWPVYNQHGNHTGRYFGALFPQHADLQVLLTDRRSGGIVARGRTIPFRWDGALDTLPAGIDAVGLAAVDAPDQPTALSALAAEVVADYQGLGLSGLVLAGMAAVTRRHRLAPLVAPSARHGRTATRCARADGQLLGAERLDAARRVGRALAAALAHPLRSPGKAGLHAAVLTLLNHRRPERFNARAEFVSTAENKISRSKNKASQDKLV
jgi:hypothetical protein